MEKFIKYWKNYSISKTNLINLIKTEPSLITASQLESITLTIKRVLNPSVLQSFYTSKTNWIYSKLNPLFFLPARGDIAELSYSIENQVNYQFLDKQSFLNLLLRITIILYFGSIVIISTGNLIKVCSEFIPVNLFTIAKCTPESVTLPY